MSDKLKNFIRRSKPKFDLEEPRPDLFYKIMENVIQEDKIIQKPNRQFNTGFNWLAIAASLILLIVCSLFFYLTENKFKNTTSQIAVNPIEQNQTTIATINSFIKEQKPQNKNDQIFNLKNKKATIQKSKKQSNNPRIKQFNNLTIQPSNNLSIKQFNPNSTVGASIKQSNNEIADVAPKDTIVSTTQNIQQFNDPTINHLNNNFADMMPATTPKIKQFNLKSTVGATIIQSNNLEIIHPLISSVSTMPEGAKLITTEQFKHDKKPTSKRSKTKAIAEDNSEKRSSLSYNIRKGIFGFLSKNTKKWTGNTLSIKNDEMYEHPILAVHLKDDKFEFSKEFKLGNFGD